MRMYSLVVLACYDVSRGGVEEGEGVLVEQARLMVERVSVDRPGR